MNNHATSTVLVASDRATDAGIVRTLLGEEFDRVQVSTRAGRCVQDFEAWRPGVRVLAFNTLQKAAQYDLGLFRLIRLVHAAPHDAPRLLPAVHHGLRQLDAGTASTPSFADFAAQARRTAGLEARRAQDATRGAKHVDAAGQALVQAGAGIGAALDKFSRRPTADESAAMVEMRNARALQGEFARAKKEQIAPQLQSAVAATRWMKSIHPFKKAPIVMSTGCSEKHEVIDSLQAGAAAFIVEPFDRTTVTAKVRKLLPN